METPPNLPKNVVIFITDQERALQHFPKDWETSNLHGLTRLKQNGLTFDNAFTNACMCSAARSTWMSGCFPAQHGVKYTLEANMDGPRYPQVELPPDLPNIATVMADAGFSDDRIVYKGKWHCSKPADKKNYHWVPSDLGKYGFARWNPQDAGADQSVPEGGGAPTDPLEDWQSVTEPQANNDGRFMYDKGTMEDGQEGVMAYLESLKAEDGEPPFFLIISLVNPHDVLFYPNETSFPSAGYDDLWLEGDIGIPQTGDPDDENYDDLDTKPKIQKRFLNLLNQSELGELATQDQMRDYINFYGNLMTSSDKYLCRVLDKLADKGLLEDTLIIRTSDHGEMGLAHGGLRQKNFNFYEESIRVPLVYSNPRLYPEPVSSQALVSHVDFLPTLASLYGAEPDPAWQGSDYACLVLDPSANSESLEDYVVFTYDDFQSGQKSVAYPPQPNHIVSLREQRFKFAKYYDPDDADKEPEWEMYDLCKDPLETTNIAYEIAQENQDAIETYGEEYDRLKAKLEVEVWQGRLNGGVAL